MRTRLSVTTPAGGDTSDLTGPSTRCIIAGQGRGDPRPGGEQAVRFCRAVANGKRDGLSPASAVELAGETGHRPTQTLEPPNLAGPSREVGATCAVVAPRDPWVRAETRPDV